MTNEGVFYNPREFVALDRTNLPAGHFLFRTHEPIYWLVAMCDFRNERLRVRVVTNDPDEEELAAFAEQRPKATVAEIWFDPFAPELLASDFTYYDRTAFNPLLRESEPRRSPPEPDLPPSSPPPTGPRGADRRLSFTLKRRLRQFRFEMGAAVVSYQGRKSPVAYPLELRVANPFFLPEFEHIKSYFGRTLGLRKVTLRVRGQVRDGTVRELRVDCPALSAIDERMIDVVRYQALRQFLRRRPSAPPPGEVDRSLFTAEELAAEDPELGNVLRWSDRALLAEFTADESIRNRAQLAYLSGKLHDPRRMLRFTLRPQFGFLFSVRGEAMDHYIWELLDSHATYIWSFDRERVAPGRQDQLLREALTQVREQGREVYRRGAVDHPEYQLSVVRHAHANSTFIDGFPRWRTRVAELLV
jgi:hypothetical protein